MFSGSHDHVLDDKGRTSLPKELRAEISKYRGDPWLTALPNCLALYPEEEFETLRRELASASKVNGAIQSLQRLITGMASRCPIDRTGRILVPPKLRSWAGLSREIVLTGVGPRIEIWERGRHQAELEKTREDYERLTRELGNFGL